MMMKSQRVLLLEDDENLGSILEEHLQMQGFDVLRCRNGVEGLDAFKREQFTLCLVDVMMPRKDGFTFAREVRQADQETPLIFLTAKSLKEDKIEGFKLGCDDYLTKPFSMEELLLRINAVLRRSRQQAREEPPTEFTVGNFHFDYTRQLLTLGKEEQRLTPKEADLLRLLCLHKNQTLERGHALEQIWGEDSYFSGRSMDVFVSKLRKYLKADQSVEIMSIHGKGLRLVTNE